jgi:formylglycine-generating enzyme required for sulfatase activity
MAGKIFINYRRDDVPGDARGIREALVAEFGKQAVFMDVDNLLAGQRFDKELEKALAQCDALIAVIGPRWMELLSARAASGERDYVREEIAAALKRGITVIPVRVGREGTMAPLPRAEQLPDDIRELVLHQKQDVAHERFGRDMVELVSALRAVRAAGGPPVAWPKIAGGAAAALAAAVAAAWFSGVIPHEPAGPKVVVYSPDTTVAYSPDTPPPATTTEGAPANRSSTPAAADAQRATTLKPGETFRDCADVCPEMVVVPAGEFMMGSPDNEEGHQKDEGPQHKVSIVRPFAVGKYEVTFDEWDHCVKDGGCKENPSALNWGRGKRPVINVSWEDITKDYLPWLNKKTGKTYRLLTEAEWEYATRARSTGIWSFGDTESELGGYAWFVGNSGGQTQPVGGKTANGFGLYDMHGNVWEWVEDCYKARYQDVPGDGSAATVGDCSSRRVFRGGDWSNGPRALRSANRNMGNSGFRHDFLGLRLARTLSP